MKTMNDPAKDAYFEPACYASRIAALISEHQSKDERPDWWQQVVAQLHSQLDKQFPQFEVEFEELTATDVIPPWKGGSAHDELPDFFRLPEMAPTRMNLLEWRQNGFEQRLGELEAHSLPYRMDTIEAFLDFNPSAPADDALPDCIHDLIASEMNLVTTHCMESAAALVTVAAAATDKRIDAAIKQTELLQSLVLNVKELLLNVDARLDALESKPGGEFDSDYWNADCCRVCGADKQATHAPWCEYRDGSPVAEIDRFRIFAESVLTRLDALESKTPR